MLKLMVKHVLTLDGVCRRRCTSRDPSGGLHYGLVPSPLLLPYGQVMDAAMSPRFDLVLCREYVRDLRLALAHTCPRPCPDALNRATKYVRRALPARWTFGRPTYRR